MKIELDTRADMQHRIQSYSPGHILVGDQDYNTSIIISPNRLDSTWPPQDFKTLQATDLARVLEFSPELILLGTGTRMQLPDSKILAPWLATEVGYEIMDTGAACRSFNILLAEGRHVVAALIRME